jgi:hypothetical protein
MEDGREAQLLVSGSQVGAAMRHGELAGSLF